MFYVFPLGLRPRDNVLFRLASAARPLLEERVFPDGEVPRGKSVFRFAVKQTKTKVRNVGRQLPPVYSTVVIQGSYFQLRQFLDG